MYFNIIVWFTFIFSIGHTYEIDSDSLEVREHSLVRPYPSGIWDSPYLNLVIDIIPILVFSTSYSYWHLTGNTIVTDRYVRLTSDTQSKAGGLWNMIPVNYPDWEMHVQFQVHGAGTLFGDGFAIWYVRDPKLSGKNKDYRTIDRYSL